MFFFNHDPKMIGNDQLAEDRCDMSHMRGESAFN